MRMGRPPMVIPDFSSEPQPLMWQDRDFDSFLRAGQRRGGGLTRTLSQQEMAALVAFMGDGR